MAGIKAHQRYRTKSGIIVPGVTTIIGQLDKPALVYWANNLGLKGISYRKALDQAASVGTIAHYLVECFFMKMEPDLDEYTARDIRQAKLAFTNFKEWWDKQELKVIASEVQLVSEQYRYGGAMDCIAESIKTGLIALIDVKTSKAIYPEMHYQLAGYKHLWEENKPSMPIDSAHIVRLSKEDGAISFHTMSDLKTEWQIFLHLRDLYELRKRGDPKRRETYRVPWWYD